MTRIEGELVINRPVEEVFDFVAAERNEPRYNPRMLRADKISPGPIGVGTRFRAETRTMRGSAEMTIEVTAYERPRRLAGGTVHAHGEGKAGSKPEVPIVGGTGLYAGATGSIEGQHLANGEKLNIYRLQIA